MGLGPLALKLLWTIWTFIYWPEDPMTIGVGEGSYQILPSKQVKLCPIINLVNGKQFTKHL